MKDTRYRLKNHCEETTKDLCGEDVELKKKLLKLSVDIRTGFAKKFGNSDDIAGAALCQVLINIAERGDVMLDCKQFKSVVSKICKVAPDDPSEMPLFPRTELDLCNAREWLVPGLL
uniref:Vacuolar protein sorting-associated protein 28 homolog n=1 Tax=Steinernema glaseri TaxID=37863 RepID=A0A1I8APD6_9BILA